MSRDAGLLDPSEWGLYFDDSPVRATVRPLASAACDCQSASRWAAALGFLAQAITELDAVVKESSGNGGKGEAALHDAGSGARAAGDGGGLLGGDSLALCRAVLLTGRSSLRLAACAPGGIVGAAEDASAAAAQCRRHGGGAPSSTLLLARALLREGLSLGCLRGTTWREAAKARVQEAKDLALHLQAQLEDAALQQDLGGGSGASPAALPWGVEGSPIALHRFNAPLALACAAKALCTRADIALAQLGLGFMDGVPVEEERLAATAALGGGGSSNSFVGGSRRPAWGSEETKEGKHGAGAEAGEGKGGGDNCSEGAMPPPPADKFEAMEAWMRGGKGPPPPEAGAPVGADAGASAGTGAGGRPPLGSTSTFPFLVTRDYGGEVRGVHMRCDVDAECEILSVGEAFVLTVEKAKAHPMCQALSRGGVDGSLSAAKHCYLALYLLCTRRDPSCPFAPYFAILPSAFPSMPLFWSPHECAWLAGSHIVEQLEDRRRNIMSDYALIMETVGDLAGAFSVEEFLWARMVVASRNFGITVDGVRTDALVPYADMLNHLRPRQTRWLYDSARRAFLIVSLQPLAAGQQVFDSYGKKCNSRFLINYGFTVEHNADDDTGQFHNELRLLLSLPSPSVDPWHWHKAERLGGGSTCVCASSFSHARARAHTHTHTPAHTLPPPTPHTHTRIRHTAHTLHALHALHALLCPRSTRSVRVSTFYDCENTLEAFSFLRFAHASGVWHGFAPSGAAAEIIEAFVAPLHPRAGASASSAVEAGSDLAHCPAALGEEQVDLGVRPIPPLSCANEHAVLRTLAGLARAQLRCYPRPLEEDLAELRAVSAENPLLPACPHYSNRRNALVLLAGEKAIAHYFIHLAAVAQPLLSDSSARRGVRGAEALCAEWEAARAGGGGGGLQGASRDRDVTRYLRSVVVPLLQRRAALEDAAADAAAAAAAAAALKKEEGVEGLNM
jgi:hypothetical protein